MASVDDESKDSEDQLPSAQPSMSQKASLVISEQIKTPLNSSDFEKEHKEGDDPIPIIASMISDPLKNPEDFGRKGKLFEGKKQRYCELK